MVATFLVYIKRIQVGVLHSDDAKRKVVRLKSRDPLLVMIAYIYCQGLWLSWPWLGLSEARDDRVPVLLSMSEADSTVVDQQIRLGMWGKLPPSGPQKIPMIENANAETPE
jgi:hypothetical protein